MWFDLSQAQWMAIQTGALIVTAAIIWRQLRAISRSTTMENFRAIDDILKTPDMRQLRRKLYQRGPEIREILQTSLESLTKAVGGAAGPDAGTQDGTRGRTDQQGHSKGSGNGLDDPKNKVLAERLKEKLLVDQLIVTFDAMGVMVNFGQAIKPIMIHMYWDVIIKMWDCLEDFIWEERCGKADTSCCAPIATDDACEDCKSKIAPCWTRFFRRVKNLLGRGLGFIYYYMLTGRTPMSLGYDFKLADFCQAPCYPRSHYENFELLVRHCEWFGWSRGIRRPKLRDDGPAEAITGEKPQAFCPICGGRLKVEGEDGHDTRTCAGCGRVHYENSKPCAVAVIVRDDTVLLNKRLIEPGRDKWDFVGGFLEKGEPPEDGLRREVEEELGVGIVSCEFLGIYMDVYGEDGDATLNIAYICEIDAKPTVATNEFSKIHWFALDELPEKYSFASVEAILTDLKRVNGALGSPMTKAQLGRVLSDTYTNAPKGQIAVMIHLFGIKYAQEIRRADVTPRELVEIAGVPPSCVTEINKGIKLSEYVRDRKRGQDSFI